MWAPSVAIAFKSQRHIEKASGSSSQIFNPNSESPVYQNTHAALIMPSAATLLENVFSPQILGLPF